MTKISRSICAVMQTEINISQLALRHIAAVVLFAVLTVLGLAIFAGISFWPAFWACIVLCSFSAFYIIVLRPFPRLQTASMAQSLSEQALLADGFAESLIIINQSQHILYANPAARAMFNVNDAAQNISNIIQDPAVLNLIKSTLAGHHPESVKMQIAEPVQQHLRVMASGIPASEGEDFIERAIIIFYDITDLVQVNTMRADFLANASHELKTPVASLLGYIETLRGHAKNDPEARDLFLETMQQQAERMQRLINDLLSLRRIEISEHLPPSETADLYLAALAAMDSEKPLATKRDIQIKYSGLKRALVIGHQDELVQLILNILDNAMQVTDEKGYIELSLEIMDDWLPVKYYSSDADFANAPRREIVKPAYSGSGYAVLRLRDYGPGFAPEHLPRIGERFYKILGNTNTKKHGTGLGLAIVKHIIRRHRGGLFIESGKGVGTIFTILLPLPPVA